MLRSEYEIGCSCMTELLVSALMHAHDNGRRDLYVWELNALRWILRSREWLGYHGNDWTNTFIDANRKLIETGEGKINFNLRAFSEARRAAKK